MNDAMTGPRLALILAAGNGARMGGARPKPLVPLLGLTLVERCVLGLASAGVDRFRVVVGARGAEVAAALAASRALAGLAIEVVFADDHALGDGHSLAAGAPDEPFILAMADDVFDPEIVRRLRRVAARQPDRIHLATDDRLAAVVDLGDQTRVRTRGDDVEAIGRGLGRHDRVALGLLACPAWLGEAARQAARGGVHALPDLLARLQSRGALRSCPIEPLVWQDVDTPTMLGEARRRLIAAAAARGWPRRAALLVTAFLARFVAGVGRLAFAASEAPPPALAKRAPPAGRGHRRRRRLSPARARARRPGCPARAR
jgi:1L-myo-inositol 1-phosphate cytidylyltransferase / CDP-L-myo-inositol myo-inositolphosphotransferase